MLEGEDLHDQVAGFIEDVVSAYALAATADGFAEEWDLDTLWQAFAGVYNIQLTIDDVVEESGGPRESLSGEVIEAIIKEDVQKAYAAREAELGEDVLRELERRVVLSVLDQKWREHLYEMDYLQEGIGLRALAQRDPVVEYQREGYDLFVAMMDAIKEESASLVFNVDVEVEATPDEGPEIITPGLAEPRRPAALQYTAPDIDAAGGLSQSVATTGPIIDPEFGEVSKNALCPCGSGRKYKRCHDSSSALITSFSARPEPVTTGPRATTLRVLS